MAYKWKDVTKDELMDLIYNKNFSILKIANLYGVAYETARRKIHSFGIILPDNLALEDEITIMVDRAKKTIEMMPEPSKYIPENKEQISLKLPIENPKSNKIALTIVLSDLHFGHCDILPQTLESTVDNLLKCLKFLKSKLEIEKIRLVLNGDIISGIRVYENQDLDNILGKGNWQVVVAYQFLKNMLYRLSNVKKVDEIYLVNGTHDNTTDDYMLMLREMLSKDYNCKASSSFLINIGSPVTNYNVFFTHGRSNSEYSPVPPIMIRDLLRYLNSQKALGIPVERVCLSHTHWCISDYECEGITIDVTGGFQRWDQSLSQRPCGFILYICTDSGCTSNRILPDKEIETLERNDPKIIFNNIYYYSKQLLEYHNDLGE